MADSSIDILRKEIFARKLSPVGKRFYWDADQIPELRDMVWSADEKLLRAAAAVKRSVSLEGYDSLRAKLKSESILADDSQAKSSFKFAFVISEEKVDLVGDLVRLAAWQNGGLDNFARNAPVLNAHDSSQPPVGTSSMPSPSGISLIAAVSFPPDGVSVASDQMRRAVAAKLIRGASVGFQPLKFSLSKDPSRPLGLDITQARLIEWSICSCPCLPSALLLGPVNEKGPARPSDAGKTAPPVAATTVATKARTWPTSPLQARDARMAEARRLRHQISAMARS